MEKKKKKKKETRSTRREWMGGMGGLPRLRCAKQQPGSLVPKKSRRDGPKWQWRWRSLSNKDQ